MVSTANLERLVDPDLQRSLHEKARVLTASELQLCRNLPPDVDLRSFELHEASRGEYSLRTKVSQVHLCQGFYAIRPFLKEGIPLGPLSSVRVYSTNAYGKWVGKAHAPTLCRYSNQIDLDDNLLELSEWLVIYKTIVDGWQSRLCSYCGGFAMRRLDEPLLSYWRDTCRIDDMQDSVSWYIKNRRVPELKSSVLSDAAAVNLTKMEAELREISERQAGLREIADRVASDAHSAARQARLYTSN